MTKKIVVKRHCEKCSATIGPRAIYCKKCFMYLYQKQHRALLNAKQRGYRKNNLERYRNYERRYALLNTNVRLAQSKRFREKNPEKVNASRMKYKNENRKFITLQSCFRLYIGVVIPISEIKKDYKKLLQQYKLTTKRGIAKCKTLKKKNN